LSRERRRPAARRVRAAPVVVDASIAVQWFANEPGSEHAARLITEDHPLLAPDIMPVEAANAWWKKVRRHEMDTADLGQAIVNLLAVGIVLHPSAALVSRAARLAVEVGHPVYDCLYLVLSSNLGADLATADERLRRAAQRARVRIWAPTRPALAPPPNRSP
jgi:predicted nucleic acid-binding protein